MWPLALAPCWAFLVQSRTWLRSPQSLRTPNSSPKDSRRNLRRRATHQPQGHFSPDFRHHALSESHASCPLRTFLSKVPHSPCTLALPRKPRSQPRSDHQLTPEPPQTALLFCRGISPQASLPKFRPTFKMSHGHSGHDSCVVLDFSPWFHFGET